MTDNQASRFSYRDNSQNFYAILRLDSIYPLHYQMIYLPNQGSTVHILS